VDGRSWLWWVIDNVVWTDTWLNIAGAGCGLICVGAGEEWVRKVYALRGLRGVERQVCLTRGTWWPGGSSAGLMVARKARWSRRSEPVQGSGSQPMSARGVCSGSPQNRPGYLVEPQNQDRRLGGQRRDPGAARSFEAEDTCRDHKACVEATRRAIAGHPSDGAKKHIPKVPLGGMYHSLGFRGILVFRLSPYILRGERMAAISRNPSSFGFPIFPSYFP
jgi:hypothetical protein